MYAVTGCDGSTYNNNTIYIMRKKFVSVSVIIPLYNKALYIGRAIRSVLRQTFQDFEIIVVDDGSTDGGAATAQSFEDERIRVITQTNRGSSAARNTGILAARSDLVAFLDADDTWNKDFLQTVLDLHEAYPQAVMFATAYLKDFSGKKRTPRLKGMPPGTWHGIIPEYFRTVLWDLPVISSAVMIKRCAFDTTGFFKEGAVLGEDQDMWCRIALRFPVAYSTRPCAVYYMNTVKSICYDRSLVQIYPVIDEIQRAIDEAWPAPCKHKMQYLSKLRIDYAVRLIRAHRFRDFFVAMANVPSPMIGRRIQVFYYLLKEMILIVFKKEDCAGNHK